MFTQRIWVKLSLVTILSVTLVACGGAEERKAKYLERGKAYLAEKNYDKAAVEIKNVLQIDPKSADGYFLMGEIEEFKNDYGKAYANYSKALELDSNNLEVRKKLARIYLMSKQPDKAEEMVTFVLQKTPGDAAAKLIHAAALAQKGNTAEAQKLALEVVHAEPSMAEASLFLSELYKNKGDLESASKVLEQSLALSPKDIQLHNGLAQIYFARNDMAKSEQMLMDVVKLEPNDLQHRVNLAVFYSRSKQFDKAEQVLRDAVKADPKDANRYPLLADFLISRGRGAEAESEMLSAIEAFPKEYRLRFALAKYYRSTGRADKAEGIYRKVIEIEGTGPNGMDARKKFADMLREQKKPAEASKLIAEVLKENPEDSEALLIRGKLELGGEKPDMQAAITDFRSVLKSQPDSAEVLTLLAAAHQLNHEPDLARSSLQKAAKAAPTNPNVIVSLARFIAGNDKDFDGAQKLLNEFLAASPNDLSVLQAKLELLSMKKDKEGMLETLARIKKAYPDKPVGYYRAGEYYLSQGQLPEALHEFEQSRDRSKGEYQSIGAIAAVYAKMKKPEEAVKVLDGYLAAHPKDLDALQMKANVLASSTDATAFVKVVDQIKQLYPDRANGYYLAGELYAGQKDYDKALREFKTAAEKSPEDARISVSILRTYIAANKPDEALGWLEQLEKARPSDGFVHYLMAEALVSQKKYADAETQFQKALQLMPANDMPNLPKRDEVYMRLADVSMMQKQPDAAMKVLKQGVAAIPGDVPLLFRLASIYQSSGQQDEAIAAYDELLKADSGNVLAANNLASLLADTKGDVASLERARRLAAPFASSTEPALLDTLGWVYYKLGDLDNALPLLKKAVEGAPKADVLRYHLGMAYYKKGDKVAAKDELTRAFASNGKFAGDEEGRAILKSLR